MPVATASRDFHIPRSTLRHKISGKAPETSGHVGPQAVLGSKTNLSYGSKIVLVLDFQSTRKAY